MAVFRNLSGSAGMFSLVSRFFLRLFCFHAFETRAWSWISATVSGCARNRDNKNSKYARLRKNSPIFEDLDGWQEMPRGRLHDRLMRGLAKKEV